MATLAATMLGAVKAIGLPTILSGAGTAVSALGAVQAGKAQNAASKYQAAQLEAAGKAENAAAQRKAEEERRQARLMQSRARAVGAASGGGVDIDLFGDIEEEGEFRALSALWEGKEAAKGRRAQAAASRFEGQSARTAGFVRGGSKLLHGGSTIIERASRSMYEKYG